MGNNRITDRPRRWSVAAAAALLAVAGCGSGGGSAGEAGTSSPSLETTSSSQVSGTAAITPPGTHLALGQPAFVQLTAADGVQGIVSIEIVSITTGTPLERAALNFPSGDAYYVTMVIQNTGSPADMGSYEPEVDAVQEDGLDANSVNEPDDFPPCPDHGPAELALGDSFFTCEAYIALPGVKVTSVEFVPGPQVDPIVWS